MPLPLAAYSEKLREESRALRETAKRTVAESKEAVARWRRITVRIKSARNPNHARPTQLLPPPTIPGNRYSGNNCG